MTSSSEQPPKERILSISSCYDCPNRMEMVCLYKPLGMISMPPGKEAFDYRNRYVCTEKDDQEITDDLPYWCPLPRPSPAPDDIAFKDSIIEQQKIHIENLNAKMAEMMHGAARKAREDVLDKVIAWKRKHGYWFTVNRISGEKRYHFEPDRFEEFIKEIRHNAQQSEQEQPR